MAPHEELLQKIGIVRSRWKAFLWLRGLAWVLGVTVVSLLIGLAMRIRTASSGWTVRDCQVALLAAVVATVIRALVIPLRRTPTDTQLARFIEEKNPAASMTVWSALWMPSRMRDRTAHVRASPYPRTLLDRTKHVRFGDQVNNASFNTFGALTGAFALSLAVALYVASLFFPARRG
jgi:hypothetical protein